MYRAELKNRLEKFVIDTNKCFGYGKLRMITCGNTHRVHYCAREGNIYEFPLIAIVNTRTGGFEYNPIENNFFSAYDKITNNIPLMEKIVDDIKGVLDSLVEFANTPDEDKNNFFAVATEDKQHIVVKDYINSEIGFSIVPFNKEVLTEKYKCVFDKISFSEDELEGLGLRVGDGFSFKVFLIYNDPKENFVKLVPVS